MQQQRCDRFTTHNELGDSPDTQAPRDDLLIAGVLHDICGALTPASGYCQLARSNSDIDATTRKMLERIAESVERAADIAKSGLIHAVPQAIHDSIPRPVSLAELGQDFQSLYQKRARQLGITTSIDMPSHLYTRNEAVVRQVLSILVENAIHAMQASGGKLTIRAKTSGQSHLIEVRDTGPGISSHREQTLFTPKPSEGTGLGIGLWLGQSLARSVGGDLQLSHSSEHGSAFMLQIPADQSAQAIPTEAAA